MEIGRLVYSREDLATQEMVKRLAARIPDPVVTEICMMLGLDLSRLAYVKQLVVNGKLDG